MRKSIVVYIVKFFGYCLVFVYIRCFGFILRKERVLDFISIRGFQLEFSYFFQVCFFVGRIQVRVCIIQSLCIFILFFMLWEILLMDQGLFFCLFWMWFSFFF